MPEASSRWRRAAVVVTVTAAVAALLVPTRCCAAAPAESPSLKHRQWKTQDGLPHNTVTAIVRDTTGYLWLGTVEGLVRFDGEVFTVFDTRTTPQLQNNFINALLAAADGSLWIGTRRGLNRYKDGTFSLYTQTDGLAGDIIEDLAVDLEGDLWIGTRSGLSRLSGGSFETFGARDGLAEAAIFALAVDAPGDLWIGSMEGLSRYSGGVFARLGRDRGLTDDFVVSLHAGPDHELWAGTVDGGLLQVDGERFLAAPALPDLEPRLVFSLLHDQGGTLWAGTRTGLVRIADGSPSMVSEVGTDLVMALFEDPEGRLWVGTLQTGLHALEVPSITPQPSDPPVIVLESLSVHQRAVLPTERIVFPKGRADVEFRYSAIDFEPSRKTRFGHMLEGYDTHWVDAGTQRYAAYTNLPPGAYRFRVRSGRVLDEGSEATYAFEVPASFHQTWWFKLLVLLALAAALWGLFLIRVRRLLRTRLHLQQRISEQTRELLQQQDQLKEFHRRLGDAHRQLQRTHRELKQRSREKSDFLAIATHDLRAPLVNLKGFAAELHFALDEVRGILRPMLEALQPDRRLEVRRALQEDGPEALSFIEGSAQRMDAVIGPILKMSRLSRQPLKLQPVSLADCLEPALVRLREELERSGVRLRITTLPGVLADPHALEEIFFQVIASGLLSLDKGRLGELEIWARRDASQVIVSVRNNGRSLDEARVARLFQPFRRSRDGAPPNPEASLGFARVLVQRHGGRVWHVSNLSIGNTVYFSIPRKPALVST